MTDSKRAHVADGADSKTNYRNFNRFSLQPRFRRKTLILYTLIICLPIGHERVYLPLCEVTGTPFNPLTAKLFNLNFHPLKVVSR